MSDQEIKVDDQSSHAEQDDLNQSQKPTAFEGPMATVPDDLTDAVINEIARSETDEAMRAEDEKVIEAISKKPTFKEKINNWSHSWWDVPKKRNTVLGLTGLFFIFLFAFPPTRYGILNTVGVRASANIKVLDSSSSQPLKNAYVTIHGQTIQTDIDGRASFDSIKLGSTSIKVEKLAYGSQDIQKTIGMGGNDLGSTNLKPVGAQYNFEVFDWLSGKSIERAEVTYYESSALADAEGKALLTIEPTDEAEIEITISAEGYRDQKYKLNTLSKDIAKIQMKVGQPNFFISNRSGKYDVYEKYVDEDATVIVSGTGNEREDMRFTISPDRKYAFLVSTRDSKRNKEGFMLSGLYKIDLKNYEIKELDLSERMDPVGWVDNKLVYVKIAAGQSGASPTRHRLVIIDPTSNEKKELASSNYFNDVVVTDNKIFYAPSNAFNEDADTALFKSDSNGNVSKVYDAEVWTIIQTLNDGLAFDATGDWYSYSIELDSTSALSGPPADRTSKIFVEGPNNASLWVDQRDGKGVLLKDHETVWTQSGLKYPVQWLSDKHVVFRVATSDETADYIINIDGGDAVKFTDVSNVPGTDRWYYY